MKNFDLGQTIGILANVGVIAGIAFLALEIRQNNDQLSAQSRFNYYQNRISAYNDVARDRELAVLITDAVVGADLSAVDQFRMTQRMLALITSWEYEFGEYENGRLSLEELNVGAKRSVFLLLHRHLVPVWETYRDTAPRAFSDFLNNDVFQP